MGGQLRADATLYDQTGAARLTVQQTAAGEREILALVEGLARQIAVGTASGPSAARVQAAGVDTRSFEALKWYLDGEDEDRHGKQYHAVAQFRRAVEADTGFALAWFRMAYDLDASGQYDSVVVDAAAHARANRSRLSPRDRELLDAWLAYQRGRANEALEGYRHYLGQYPGDLVAWMELGDIEVHYGPLFGRTGAAARAVFEHILSIDTGADNARNHLQWVARTEGRHAEADSLAARLFAAKQGGLTLFWQSLLAVSHRNAAEERQVVAALRGTHEFVAWTAGLAGIFIGNPAAAERLSRPTLDESRSRMFRVTIHLRLANSALGRGHIREAREEVLAAGALDSLSGLEHEALLLRTSVCTG